MSFREKIQKDIKKNLKEGLAIVRGGSAAVSQKLEEITEESRKKYKIFTLKMKVKDEFSRLGGKIYDLSFKAKNPMSHKRVTAIISRIKKFETQIACLEKKKTKRPVKTGSNKIRRKTIRK